MSLEEIIAVARGLKPADLVIRNARVVDVLSGEIFSTDVAVHAGRVAGFGNYEGLQALDLEGRWLCPGFIDAHLHIESTMLTPPEFARIVSPLGTTSVVCDPHEIGNVLGMEGIGYMLRSSADLPVNIFVMASSCVPATHLETSGAELNAGDLELLMEQERVLGLAEMMNFPGVLDGDPDVLAKLRAAAGHPIDGHAPGLSGRDLSAYVAAGIGSDHECVTASEALEKLRLGMHIMVREGSTEKNLKEIVKIINRGNSHRFLLCSDDRDPADLLTEGHIDYNIRLTIAEGIEPVVAVQMATINTANYFGLRDLGAVAPGYRADLVALDDLESVKVSTVLKDGQFVFQDGKAAPFAVEAPAPHTRETVNISAPSLDRLGVEAFPGSDVTASAEAEAALRMKVIGIVPGQIVTETRLLEPKLVHGMAVADPARDILKIAVFERHHATGNVGVGFVQGMGLRGGAIATSVAHDSHNVIVVGATDADMRAAVFAVAEMQGGAVVVSDGEVQATLPLPVAGLMSERPGREVADALQEVIAAAHDLGCSLPDPLSTLSFMALPVIPELKITDMGLVDVAGFELTDLFEYVQELI